MSHCSRLLDELAQADPDLKAALGGPGPRPSLVSAVACASEPLMLVFGLPARVVYSDSIAELLGSDHTRIFARLLPGFTWEGEAHDVVGRALRSAGAAEPIGDFGAIPIPDEQGNRCAILCVAQRARPREAARAPVGQQHGCNDSTSVGLATLESVLDAIDQGCMIMNMRFEVLAVNRMAARIARRSQDQILGATHWSLWPSSIDTPPGRMYRRVLQTGRAEDLDHHYVGEGIDMWLRIHSYRVAGSVVSLFRDITREIRALNVEEDHRARWNAAKAAVGSLWTLTAAGRMEGSQPGWEAVSGQGQEDYEGYGWLGAIHPDEAEWASNAFEAAVVQKERFEVTPRVKRPDGAWRPLRLCIVPVVRDADQSLTQWVGAAHEAPAQGLPGPCCPAPNDDQGRSGALDPSPQTRWGDR